MDENSNADIVEISQDIHTLDHSMKQHEEDIERLIEAKEEEALLLEIE